MAKYVKTEDGYKALEKLNLMNQFDPVGSGSFSLNRKTNTTIGYNSVAIGSSTIASGDYSHAEGVITTASGYASHAEGLGTKASSGYQHVQGKYNIVDTNSKYAYIIGNGTSGENLHNCFMIDWNGAIYVQAADDATKMMKITVNSDGTIVATQATV